MYCSASLKIKLNSASHECLTTFGGCVCRAQGPTAERKNRLTDADMLHVPSTRARPFCAFPRDASSDWRTRPWAVAGGTARPLDERSHGVRPGVDVHRRVCRLIHRLSSLLLGKAVPADRCTRLFAGPNSSYRANSDSRGATTATVFCRETLKVAQVRECKLYRNCPTSGKRPLRHHIRVFSAICRDIERQQPV